MIFASFQYFQLHSKKLHITSDGASKANYIRRNEVRFLMVGSTTFITLLDHAGHSCSNTYDGVRQKKSLLSIHHVGIAICILISSPFYTIRLLILSTNFSIGLRGVDFWMFGFGMFSKSFW